MSNYIVPFHIGDKLVLIDPLDFDLLSFRWHITKTGYAARNAGKPGATLFMHRLILGRIIDRDFIEGEYTDHINGNRLDNRRTNLRVATKLENCRNAKRYKNNQSGYKGVGWDKSHNCWRARIKVNGKLKRLGLFKTPEEAYTAYCNAATQIFGEFARLEK